MTDSFHQPITEGGGSNVSPETPMICIPCARLADAGVVVHSECEDIVRFFDRSQPLGDLPVQRSCTCQHEGARGRRQLSTTP